MTPFWQGVAWGIGGMLALAVGAAALFAVMARRAPRERGCRVCGCREYDACFDPLLGPCWWVEEDLCSRCTGGEPAP